jgi:hypothetical protein
MVTENFAEAISLRQFTCQLNQRLVPSKNWDTWQANTIQLILARI